MTSPSMPESAAVDVLVLRQLLHDVNQPLTAIGNYAHVGQQLLTQGSPDPARLLSLFEKINQQAQRAQTLSRQISQTLPRVPSP